jgi:hypothetical protein
VHAGRLCQPSQSHDADILFSPVDTAHLVRVQVGTFSKLLLRNPGVLAQRPHPTANRNRQVALHASIVGGLDHHRSTHDSVHHELELP